MATFSVGKVLLFAVLIAYGTCVENVSDATTTESTTTQSAATQSTTRTDSTTTSESTTTRTCVENVSDATTIESTTTQSAATQSTTRTDSTTTSESTTTTSTRTSSTGYQTKTSTMASQGEKDTRTSETTTKSTNTPTDSSVFKTTRTSATITTKTKPTTGTTTTSSSTRTSVPTKVQVFTTTATSTTRPTTVATIQPTTQISTTSSHITSISTPFTVVSTQTNNSSSSNAGAIAGGVTGCIAVIAVCILVFIFFKRRFRCPTMPNLKKRPDELEHTTSEEAQPGNLDELYARVNKNGKLNDTNTYVNSLNVDEVVSLCSQNEAKEKTITKDSCINRTVINELRELFSQANMNTRARTDLGEPLTSVANVVSHNDYDHVQRQSAKFPVSQYNNYDHVIVYMNTGYEEIEIDTTEDNIVCLAQASTEDSYDKLDRFAPLKLKTNTEDPYHRLQRFTQSHPGDKHEQLEMNYDYAAVSSLSS